MHNLQTQCQLLFASSEKKCYLNTKQLSDLKSYFFKTIFEGSVEQPDRCSLSKGGCRGEELFNTIFEKITYIIC